MTALQKRGLQIVFLFTFVATLFVWTPAVNAQSAAEWKATKRRCGLPDSLLYNNWDGRCPAEESRNNNTNNNSNNNNQARQAEEKRKADEVAAEAERQRIANKEKKDAADRQRAFEKNKEEGLKILKDGTGDTNPNELPSVDPNGKEIRSGGSTGGLPGVSPSGDPMVVDARNVPSGLPSLVEASIPNTPAGDFVRKGFQAAANHNWKAALAWFRSALKQEPGDPGIMRLVDLAQYTLLRQGPQKATANTDKVLDSGLSEGLNKSLFNYNKTHITPKWLRPAPGSDSNPDWLNESEPGHVCKQFFRLLTPTLRNRNGEPINTGTRG